MRLKCLVVVTKIGFVNVLFELISRLFELIERHLLVLLEQWLKF